MIGVPRSLNMDTVYLFDMLVPTYESTQHENSEHTTCPFYRESLDANSFVLFACCSFGLKTMAFIIRINTGTSRGFGITISNASYFFRTRLSSAAVTEPAAAETN